METTVKPNKLLARSKANKLLKELSISKPPVPLNLLLRHEDLTQFPANFTALGIKNISALIEYESGMILYDTNSSYVRQRFSIAHELGHYVLNHKNVFGHVIDFDQQEAKKHPQEVEADQFAAELLMPFDWVKYDRQHGIRSVEDLAKRYIVSLEAMRWRLIGSDVLLQAR